MQFWPRKKAKSQTARVRAWTIINEPKLLGFAGYKVGMTHTMLIDNRKTSPTKGEEIVCPVTVIECPALKSASLRFYQKTIKGLQLCSEVLADSLDKELARTLSLPKKARKKIEDIKHYDLIRLLVYTQPKLTGIGKKRPEVFELGLGGTKEQQLELGKTLLGKEIPIKDVFQEGQMVDIHAVTKGKGFQGPVKRFGVDLKQHKSEKGVRRVGSLGGWKAQGHITYRVAHAGQMGYHTRMEYNKWILKIGEKPEDINVKGGFLRYGFVKNPYLLIRGSVGGPSKRLIRMNMPTRPKPAREVPPISYISLSSPQGN